MDVGKEERKEEERKEDRKEGRKGRKEGMESGRKEKMNVHSMSLSLQPNKTSSHLPCAYCVPGTLLNNLHTSPH